MRLAVVGAGATGGWLGARLARAGHSVVLVARGPHLEAMRARGLRVVEEGAEFTVHPDCTDDWEVIREADVVVLTLKAHSVPAAAPRLGALLRDDAVLVTAQNGIPWWYFEHCAGPFQGRRLESVDPQGAISSHINSDRVVAGIVYPATNVLEPGVVQHVEGDRVSIGELDGSLSDRCAAISEVFGQAGIDCPVRADIRGEIWLKLLGNAVFNPMSALGRATLEDITHRPDAAELARATMEEVDSVARALGIEIERGVERRLRGASRVGPHKTSMLQDLEAGRPLEVEALVGAVVEIGGWLSLPLPRLTTLYVLLRLLNTS